MELCAVNVSGDVQFKWCGLKAALRTELDLGRLILGKCRGKDCARKNKTDEKQWLGLHGATVCLSGSAIRNADSLRLTKLGGYSESRPFRGRNSPRCSVLGYRKIGDIGT